MSAEVIEELLNVDDDTSGAFSRDELFGVYPDESLSWDDLDTDVFDAGE